MGKPKAPPPPDYTGAALAQGQQNKDIAIFNAGINRPDEIDPYGQRTWTLRPGADPKNPKPGDYVLTTSLSGDQQGILDAQERISQAYLGTGEQMLGRVNDRLLRDFDASGLPGQRSDLRGASWIQGNVPNQSVTAAQSPVQAVQPGQNAVDRLQAPNSPFQSVDPGTNPYSRVDPTTTAGPGPNLRQGTSTDTADLTRQRVVDAMMSRVNPDLDRQEAATRQRLMSSGLEMGTEAWNAEMQRVDRARNDALMQAQLAGGQEASRILGDQRQNQLAAAGINANEFQLGLARQGQAFGQGLQSAQFGNQWADQDFTRRLAAAGFANQTTGQDFAREVEAARFSNEAVDRQFGRNLQAGEFANTTTGRDFDRTLAAAQFGNQAAGQRFAQDMASQEAFSRQDLQAAQFQNQARQQALEEALMLRQLPLNEANALRTGAQVQLPGRGAGPGGNVPGAQPTDLMQALMGRSQWDAQMYNQAMQGYNNTLQTGAMAAMMYFSDRRLKTNIRRIGTHPVGVPRYAWDWVNGRGSDIGVMADELREVMPEAVGESDGYLTVNYDMIGGR